MSQAGYGPESPANVQFSFFPAETLSNAWMLLR